MNVIMTLLVIIIEVIVVLLMSLIAAQVAYLMIRISGLSESGLSEDSSSNDTETVEYFFGGKWLTLLGLSGAIVYYHWSRPPGRTVATLLPGLETPISALVTATSLTVSVLILGSFVKRKIQPRTAKRTLELENFDLNRLRREKRLLAAATVFTAALLIEVVRVGISTFWLLPGGLVLTVAYVHLYRQIDPGFYYVREPTAEETDLIERCYDRFDRKPGRIYVYSLDDPYILSLEETDRDDYDWVKVTNFPGRERPSIWIEEEFLSDSSEMELAGILAQADYLARRHEGVAEPLRLAGFVGSLLLIGWALYAFRSLWLAAGLFVSIIVVFGVVGGYADRVTFDADDFASDHVGVNALVRAYREYSRTFRSFSGQSIEERIKRLEKRREDAEDRSDDDSDGNVPDAPIDDTTSESA